MVSIHIPSARRGNWLLKALLFCFLFALILPTTRASILSTTRWGQESALRQKKASNTTETTKTATAKTTKTAPEWHKWFTLAVIIVLFLLMAFDWRSTDTVAFMALVLLWNAGIISATDAMSGFSNSGMLTVGVLFVVVHGVDKSQIAPYLGRKVFGVQTGERWALFRLSWFAFALSAFLNNTPIVAMLTPIVRDWARSRGFHPSTFLIPLSYATAAGGMVTKIGTSTTLVVSGLVIQAGLQDIGFFDIALVALPAGFLSVMVMVWLAPIILPRNDGLFREIKASNSDIVTEVEILPNFPLVGKSAGFVLASLGFNIEVLIKVRRPQVSVAVAPASTGAQNTAREISPPSFADIFPVDPSQVLLAGDVLFLSGGKSKMMEVLRGVSTGLQILGFTADQLEGTDLHFVEVILSDRNPFVGDVVMNTSFSSHYGVSILALRRKGRTNALKVSTIPGARMPVTPTSIPSEPPIQMVPPMTLEGTFDGGANAPALSSFGLPNLHQGTVTPVNISQDKPASTLRARKVVDAPLPPERYRSKSSVKSGQRNDSIDAEQGEVDEVNEHDPVHLEVGKSRLKIGDALLLLARDDFIETYSHKPDFIMVQTIEKKSPPVRPWDYVPLLIFAAMVISVAIFDSKFDMLQASMAAAALLIFGGWIDAKTAVNLVEWDLLLLIGCMLGLSKAMTNSGLADSIANLISGSGISPIGALFVLYIVSCAMTEVLSNNGCAGLCFPIAIGTAKALGVSYMPFVIIVMFGATTSFLTPIGYQCNMMVWAPGGYSFADFTKMGIPLNIIYTLVICLLSPLIWPLNDERYIIPK